MEMLERNDEMQEGAISWTLLSPASRRGRDKWGFHRSAINSRNELSRENAGKMRQNYGKMRQIYVKMRQNAAPSKRIKQNISKCKEIAALLRKHHLSRPRLEAGE